MYFKYKPWVLESAVGQKPFISIFKLFNFLSNIFRLFFFSWIDALLHQTRVSHMRCENIRSTSFIFLTKSEFSSHIEITKIWLKLKSILVQKTKTKSKMAAKNNTGVCVSPRGLLGLIVGSLKSAETQGDWERDLFASSPTGSLLPLLTATEENKAMIHKSLKLWRPHGKIGLKIKDLCRSFFPCTFNVRPAPPVLHTSLQCLVLSLVCCFLLLLLLLLLDVTWQRRRIQWRGGIEWRGQWFISWFLFAHFLPSVGFSHCDERHWIGHQEFYLMTRSYKISLYVTGGRSGSLLGLASCLGCYILCLLLLHLSHLVYCHKVHIFL